MKGRGTMPVSTLLIKGKKVILVDCSMKSVKTNEDVVKTLKQGSEAVAACAKGSALIITDVTERSFDSKVSDEFKAYASRNTPYVKASVMLGLNGMQKIIFNAIITFTKREYYIAKSLEDAKTYLADK